MASYLVILFVKGHDTVVVMDNSARENTMPTHAITRNIAR